jgi:hypothetical protein
MEPMTWGWRLFTLVAFIALIAAPIVIGYFVDFICMVAISKIYWALASNGYLAPL